MTPEEWIKAYWAQQDHPSPTIESGIMLAIAVLLIAGIIAAGMLIILAW